MKQVIIRLILLFSMISSAQTQEAQLNHVIAHRGASFDAPENTRAAITLAMEQGAGVIEFDVMKSKDGELFLFHDQDLKRLGLREGVFKDLSADEVRKLDVGRWFNKGHFPNETPPTLKEAITLCLDGGSIPLIEQKTGSPKAYAKVLTELDAVEKVIVQSFDWRFLKEIQVLLPTLKIGALGKKQLAKWHGFLLNEANWKPNWVGWSNSDIKEADVKWLKENDFFVAIWTVNDPKRAKQLLDWGVDKIITDRPAFIEAQLERIE